VLEVDEEEKGGAGGSSDVGKGEGGAKDSVGGRERRMGIPMRRE